MFCAGVDHAIHTTEILNKFGITAKCIHGGSKTHKMSNGERDQGIADFKAGKYKALVNNNVLTTGFDHPPIDLILMLRPTSSPGLWVQMLGRGTRPYYQSGFDLSTAEGRLAAIANSPKRDCMVLDFGGNTKRLGPINDPVVPKAKGKGKGGTAPVRLCDAILQTTNQPCNHYVHASASSCPYCGFVFPRATKLQDEAATDEIIKTKKKLIKNFKVKTITYAIHLKNGSPPSMKVNYNCGNRSFNQYLCFEHEGYAKRKAIDWWAEHATPVESQGVTFPPSFSAEAIKRSDELKIPTHLAVWVNTQYPEILEHDYTGTNFGTLPKDNDAPKILDVSYKVPQSKFAFN